MIKSYTNKHGRTVHYDEAGNKVGVSYQSKSGGRVTHYDESGKETGRSYVNASGCMTHYNANGEKTGTSYTAYPGRVRHYDNQWHKTGDTQSSFAGYKTEIQHTPGQGRKSGAGANSAGCATLLMGLICLLAIVGLAMG